MVRGRFFGAGVWASRALLLLTLCSTSRAHAQYASPVFVRVNTGGPAFTVSVPERRHVPAPQLADCAQACGFWAYPGDYVVRVHLPEQDANVTLRVRGPGNYDFIPANGGARSAGLVLGIVGPVALTVGAVMVIAGAYNSSCADAADPRTPCKTPAIAYYGAATFLAGVGMTTAGWVVYVANRARFQRSELGPFSPATPRLGLVPMPRGGLGFGATVAF